MFNISYIYKVARIQRIKKKKKKIAQHTNAIGSVEVLGVISQDLFVYCQGSILVSLFL